MVSFLKRLGTSLFARSDRNPFHSRSRQRYGILAGVWSPPHQKEVDAAGAEPAQGHLLHVEQAQDHLDIILTFININAILILISLFI